MAIGVYIEGDTVRVYTGVTTGAYIEEVMGAYLEQSSIRRRGLQWEIKGT